MMAGEFTCETCPLWRQIEDDFGRCKGSAPSHGEPPDHQRPRGVGAWYLTRRDEDACVCHPGVAAVVAIEFDRTKAAIQARAEGKRAHTQGKGNR